MVSERRVLIVNEDGDLTKRVGAAFEAIGNGYEVLSALSAPRAIGMANAKQPDVILVDAGMTSFDGYAFTKQMKQDDALSGIPVIILTEQPTEASALKARQAGAVAHMSSSAEPEGVVRRIVELVGPSSDSEGAGISVTDQAGGAGSTRPDSPEVASSAASARVSEDAQAPGAGVGSPAGYGAPKEPGSYGVPQAPPKASAADVPKSQPRDGVTGDRQSTDVPHIDDLLRLLVERGGSDLHVSVGSPPGLRLRGEIVPLENMRILTSRDTMEMILNLLSEEQRRKFEIELELDFAYSIPGLSRFRANVFQQRNSMAAVFRTIPLHIPTFESLGLPKVCRYLAERPRGMVLVTGPTGSGKSTTLAAMVDHINSTKPLHIITLEDPIEFMHKNKRAVVNQREVGEDTHSFASALKRVLRQDPDVILVGEMRDLETISAAITAAETGHLVFATLHTTGGPETVDRIIDVFPPHQQQQVRMQLSNTLEGVLSQVLLRSTDGKSRMLAMEIMLGVPAIKNLIREGKTHQMDSVIQGGAQSGMQTLDQSLKQLLQQGRITFEDAIGKSQNPKELAELMGRKLI